MNKILLSASMLLLSFSAWLQPLAGNYTIDPGTAPGGTNYQTFTAFIADLGTNGVSAAVTVNVKEGLYSESLNFTGHTGASAANLVTIQADPLNTLPAEVNYAATGSTEGTVNFLNTSFVKIDGLKLSSSGATYTRIVYVSSGSGDITFSNNTFENVVVSNSSSTFYTAVYGTSLAATGNGFAFVNNTFNNGSHLIYLTASTTARTPKLVFTGNVANGFTGYGLYNTYVDTVIIQDNEFNQSPTSVTSYGMYFTNSTTSNGSYHDIQRNHMRFATSSTFYGIYTSYTGSSAGNPSKIINNMISNDNTGSTSTRYGIYLLAPGNYDVYHNSVHVTDGSATASRSVYINGTTSTLSYTPGGLNFQNNIVSNIGDGYAIEVATNATGYFSSLNYNVYNGNAVNPLRWASTNYTDIPSWQAVTSMEVNSLLGDPVFSGNSDLHLVGPLANDVGNNAVGVIFDIDGDTRPLSPSTTVDIGADEFTVASCIGPNSLNAINIGFDQVDLTWSVNGTETAWVIEVVLTGVSPTGSGTSVSTNPYTWTGLSAETTYDFYVQADCGTSTSTFSGPYTFTTGCGPVIAPWIEPLTVTTTPNCWSQSATSGGPWVFTGDPGYDVSGVLDHTNGSINNYAWIDHSGTDISVILESPIIDVNALNVPELRFWMYSHYTGSLSPYNPTYVEAFDGTTWQQIDVVQGDFGPQWKEFNYLITPSLIYGAGYVKVRFRAESGGASLDFNNDILLDDVSITEAPACPAPMSLTLLGADTTSSIFTWTAMGSETEWKIEYGPAGFTPGSGTVELTSTNPDTISGLTPNSFYNVYVYAVCSPGDTSTVLGPLNFNTYNQGAYMEADNTCGPGFIDITATGVNLMLTDDSEVGFTLPFPWLFQGVLVNQITIGNNGAVLVNTLTGNVGYTMTSGNGFYPFIQDLDNDINGVDQVGVLWGIEGTAPNRKFIVMWKDRTHFSGFSNPNPCTFEFVYEEATNEAYYTYPDVDFSNPSYDNGADAEIGVRGPGNNIDVSINSANYLQNNDCVHLYYTDCPKPTNLTLQYVTPDEAAFTWTAGLSNEANWTIIYGPAGFDPMTGGFTITSTTSSTILIGLEQLTEYDIYIYADCASGDQSFALKGNFKTTPLCADPTGVLANTAVDSLLSDWTWTEFSSLYPAIGFDIYYGGVGFDPMTGGTVVNSDVNFGDTTVDIELLGGGVYEMYLQAVCDTLVSNYVGPITFTMPLTNDDACGAILLETDGTVYTFNNSGATVQTNEINIAPPVTGAQTTDGWLNNTLSFTTWFKFVAPASGNIRISGVDKGFNGQVAAYLATDCNDFTTFTLNGANDDEIDGTSLASNFTLCGLTPNAEYYLMHDSYSTSQTGIYTLKITTIDLNAGAAGSTVNICAQDTVSLFNGISGNDTGGTWIDLENTFHIVNGDMFNTNGLAYQTYMFEYRIVDGCAMDSVVANYEVFSSSSAGDDGAITICKNEPTGLLSALGGTFQSGGQWYDATNAPKTGSYIAMGELTIPGQYNYKYIVGNGVCEDDTSIVTVTVLANCDFLGLEQLEEGQLSVYPNPTQGFINISFEDVNIDMNIELMDASGKLIQTLHRSANDQMVNFDLTSLERGVYIVRFNSDEFTGVQRVIKE